MVTWAWPSSLGPWRAPGLLSMSTFLVSCALPKNTQTSWGSPSINWDEGTNQETTWLDLLPSSLSQKISLPNRTKLTTRLLNRNWRTKQPNPQVWQGDGLNTRYHCFTAVISSPSQDRTIRLREQLLVPFWDASITWSMVEHFGYHVRLPFSF